jgi:hypothetical protein
MELIRCPRCAKEIPDVSRFCRRCGASMGWGLAEGMSPAWSDSSGAGVFADVPVTLASKPELPPKPKWEPADLPKRRKIEPKRNNGGGACAASIMIGVAAMTFFAHVHRMATRPVAAPAPVVSPRLIYPPQFQTSPAMPAPMRGVSRGIPDDAIDWRFAPPPPPTPAPPLIVRPGPPRGAWERPSPDVRRQYRGWEDRGGERGRDSRED